MLSIDLSKQQALDAAPKEIPQINLTGNLSGNNIRLMFFIIEEAKETILDFSRGTECVPQFYFDLMYYQYKMT